MISVFVFFFKQKTAYEMRISDWSSDVCSSDLTGRPTRQAAITPSGTATMTTTTIVQMVSATVGSSRCRISVLTGRLVTIDVPRSPCSTAQIRSEEHTSELQSLLRTSYAVFCLKTTTNNCLHTQRLYPEHKKPHSQ